MFAPVSFAKKKSAKLSPRQTHVLFKAGGTRCYGPCHVRVHVPLQVTIQLGCFVHLNIMPLASSHHAPCAASHRFRTWTGPPKSTNIFTIWFGSVYPLIFSASATFFIFRRNIVIDPISSTSHNALAVVSRGGQLGSQLICFRGGIVPRDGSSNSCLVWPIPFQMLKPRTYLEIKFFSRNMVFFKRIPFSKSTFMVFPFVLCGSRGRAKS